MALNLCSSHFQTSIQCDKLCADGYDVSNLLSADPAARRRGFKLEYFLRAPFHVTLSFREEVDLCRLDLELWPWGMDQGRSSRRLEILTCPERDGRRFDLATRCDLRDELRLCFRNPAFRARAPFRDAPPQAPAGAKTQELRRLGSVARLRVGVPFSGAAAALGIKSLAVWASPSRRCSASELETLREAHLKSVQSPNLFAASPAPLPNPIPSDTPIPEEFLDPLTQELMVFPVILPSGMIVDSGTLEEYQKREATWGRSPNDPFTGVPFTQNSKPLPNALLKSRIDRLALRTGCTGVGGDRAGPRPSRLTPEVRLLPGSGCDRTDGSRAPGSDSKATAGSRENQSRSAKRKHESGLPSSAAEPDRSVSKRACEAPSEPDSHERRLADSLDQALNAALRGLPAFTSASVQRSSGLQECVFCSRGLSVFSSSASYSLVCSHLVCGACLRRREIKCPACGSSSSGRDIARVHP
ncbi:RING finger protein 37 [Puntigrus tetrazona]|uniref:RING finger protein 37 n=1 Tax=Puntigrus tetrazona TaxID=1606681 RepID=UPI001C8AAC70|nr:RING finger protein 37 [Puntigrus tetrazona]XP_043102716.1 RING finger protein 37 [Puntigrus tetrazona]XP_043102717.1 RING finger protein 37 [Puntigrus tetrazona]